MQGINIRHPEERYDRGASRRTQDIAADYASAGASGAAAAPSSTTLPPAASTAAIADFDAPATSIVIAAVSLPLAKRRMPSPWRRSTPAATSLAPSSAPSLP